MFLMCKTFKQLPKFTPSGKHFSTFIVSPNSRRVSSPFKKLALSNSFLKLNHFSSLPSNPSSNSSFSSFLSSPLSFAKGWEHFPRSKNSEEKKNSKEEEKGNSKGTEKKEKKAPKFSDPESYFQDFFKEQRAKKMKSDGGGGGGSGSRILIILGSLFIVYLLYEKPTDESNTLGWSQFCNEYLAQRLVKRVIVRESDPPYVIVILKDNRELKLTVGSIESFEKKLEEAQTLLGVNPTEFIPVSYRQSYFAETISTLASIALTIGMFYLIFNFGSQARARGMGGGNGIFSIGKSNAKLFSKQDKITTRFSDVAGLPEAKQEIMEFVDFLKNPKKYEVLGAKIPKGAILVGPPGTGKTLLAKATAGEASVPFWSTSGSDFMEMFVGVGPARVRDLFQQAKETAPCIIFIDEIDAIGRARNKSGFSSGHDERENTLNQILVEMDGFSPSTGVIVLAGTNRPDVLDKALLRPGRFDRQIAIDKPDIKSREEIFSVHLKPLKLEKPIEAYIKILAQLTPGFSGADIANACNEAALIAARNKAEAVTLQHLEAALDRIIGGLEKKNKVISPEEKKTIAFHEAGHTVAGWFLQYAEPVLKVSIIPRGSGLGFSQILPDENYLLTKDQLADRMAMALGGRVAEELTFGKISTGAQDDLNKVTRLAYSQIKIYGMNEKLGPLSFQQDRNSLRPFSEDTAQLIDEEVRLLIQSAYNRTSQILTEKKELLEKVALNLLNKEVLNSDELKEILGERPKPPELKPLLDS